jgi:hypothetical protein
LEHQTFSCDCPSGPEAADYIDDYYYQILYPPVWADERDYSSDNRTKFDFVVACGLAELADEDGMGGPASGSGSASGKRAPCLEYTKTQAVEKDGARYL